MTNIVLFGAPGAGKGTQACLVAAQFGLNHVSTGEIIRREIAAETAIGLTLRDSIGRGELAPDSLVTEIIENIVHNHPSNIFDGFPRTIPQARALDEIMKRHNLQIDAMIELVVPEEILVERILLRAQCSHRADDADESIIRNRIEIYHAQTEPVADFYKRQKKYISIDGNRPVEQTHAELAAVLSKLRIES